MASHSYAVPHCDDQQSELVQRLRADLLGALRRNLTLQLNLRASEEKAAQQVETVQKLRDMLEEKSEKAAHLEETVQNLKKTLEEKVAQQCSCGKTKSNGIISKQVQKFPSYSSLLHKDRSVDTKEHGSSSPCRLADDEEEDDNELKTESNDEEDWKPPTGIGMLVDESKSGSSSSFNGEEQLKEKSIDDGSNTQGEGMLDPCMKYQTKKNKLTKCLICYRACMSDNSLREHMYFKHNGEKPYSCDFCLKEFVRRDVWKIHLRIHTGEKPYSCPKCGKRFSNNSQLCSHSKTHNKTERKFHCSVCSKSFLQKSTLKAHMDIHLGIKPYKCSYCSKEFLRKRTYTMHLRIHTGEKGFQCNICGKSYIEPCQRTQHMKRHAMTKKPLECPYCSKGFYTKSSLQCHVVSHTGEKNFLCSICGKAFGTKAHVRQHIRVVHDKNKNKEKE